MRELRLRGLQSSVSHCPEPHQMNPGLLGRVNGDPHESMLLGAQCIRGDCGLVARALPRALYVICPQAHRSEVVPGDDETSRSHAGTHTPILVASNSRSVAF
jgi:hypothetical protein